MLYKAERSILGKLAQGYMAIRDSGPVQKAKAWNEADKKRYERVFGPPVKPS